MSIALFHFYRSEFINDPHCLILLRTSDRYGFMSIVSQYRVRKRAGKIVSWFFLITVMSYPLHAQWSAVAPSLLGMQNIQMGCITHKSGLTWAGSLKVVFMSPDSGLSWINRSPGIVGNDYLNDITFFDNQTGLVCTYNGLVFRTDDQGKTWRQIFIGSAFSAAFLGSTDNIVIATGACTACAAAEISHDGGITWKSSQILGDWMPQVRCALADSLRIVHRHQHRKVQR